MIDLLNKVVLKNEYFHDISVEQSDNKVVQYSDDSVTYKDLCYLPGSIGNSVSWSFFVENPSFSNFFLGCCVNIDQNESTNYILYSTSNNKIYINNKVQPIDINPIHIDTSMLYTFTIYPKENRFVIRINRSEYILTYSSDLCVTSVYPCTIGGNGIVTLQSYSVDADNDTFTLQDMIHGYKQPDQFLRVLSLTPFYNYHFMRLPEGCNYVDNSKIIHVVKQSKGKIIMKEEFTYGSLNLSYVIQSNSSNTSIPNVTIGYMDRTQSTIFSFIPSQSKLIYNGMSLSIPSLSLTLSSTLSFSIYINNEEQMLALYQGDIVLYQFSISASRYSYIPYVEYEDVNNDFTVSISSISISNTIITTLPDWIENECNPYTYDLPLSLHTNKLNTNYIYLHKDQPCIYAKPNSSVLAILPYGIIVDPTYSGNSYTIEFESLSVNRISGTLGCVQDIYDMNHFYSFHSDGSLVHNQNNYMNQKNASFSSHDRIKLELTIDYKYNDQTANVLYDSDDANEILLVTDDDVSSSSSNDNFIGGITATLFINGIKQQYTYNSIHGIVYPALYLESSQGFKLLSYKATTNKNIHIYTQFSHESIISKPLTFNKTLHNLCDTVNNSIHSGVNHETYLYNINLLSSSGRIVYTYKIQSEGESYGLCHLPIKDYTSQSVDSLMYCPSEGTLSIEGTVMKTLLQTGSKDDQLKIYIDYDLHLITFYINDIQISDSIMLPEHFRNTPFSPAVYVPSRNIYVEPLTVEYLTPQSVNNDVLFLYNQNQVLNRLFEFYERIEEQRAADTDEWRQIFKETKLDDYHHKTANGKGANSKVYQFQLDKQLIHEKFPNKNASTSFALKRPFTVAFLQPAICNEFYNDYSIPVWTPSKYLPQSYYYLNDYIYDMTTVESEDKVSSICYSIVEYMYDTVQSYLNKSSLSPDIVLLILLQMSYAINHLYSLSMSHRDIKLDNLMMTHPGFPDDVKLIDLGGCTNSLMYDIKNGVGNFSHRAPELFVPSSSSDNNPIIVDHSTSDMWGLGVLALELCIYPDIPIDSFDLTEEIPDVLPHTEEYDKIAKFIQAALVVNPSQRITPPEGIQLLEQLIWGIPDSKSEKYTKYYELAKELDYNFLLCNRYTSPLYLKNNKEELLLDMIIHAFKTHDYI